MRYEVRAALSIEWQGGGDLAAVLISDLANIVILSKKRITDEVMLQMLSREQQYVRLMARDTSE